jgi:hypothetical protein
VALSFYGAFVRLLQLFREQYLVEHVVGNWDRSTLPVRRAGADRCRHPLILT